MPSTMDKKHVLYEANLDKVSWTKVASILGGPPPEILTDAASSWLDEHQRYVAKTLKKTKAQKMPYLKIGVVDVNAKIAQGTLIARLKAGSAHLDDVTLHPKWEVVDATVLDRAEAHLEMRREAKKTTDSAKKSWVKWTSEIADLKKRAKKYVADVKASKAAGEMMQNLDAIQLVQRCLDEVLEIIQASDTAFDKLVDKVDSARQDFNDLVKLPKAIRDGYAKSSNAAFRQWNDAMTDIRDLMADMKNQVVGFETAVDVAQSHSLQGLDPNAVATRLQKVLDDVTKAADTVEKALEKVGQELDPEYEPGMVAKGKRMTGAAREKQVDLRLEFCMKKVQAGLAQKKSFERWGKSAHAVEGDIAEIPEVSALKQAILDEIDEALEQVEELDRQATLMRRIAVSIKNGTYASV